MQCKVSHDPQRVWDAGKIPDREEEAAEQCELDNGDSLEVAAVERDELEESLVDNDELVDELED